MRRMTLSQPDSPNPLPRPFGDYTLLALLGRGGMGEVYLATRAGVAGIARRCVVKTLRAGFGADDEYVRRFLDEARVVVELSHKNICPVFDVGKVDGQYYLGMEYLAGRDLRTVQARAREEGSALGQGLALFVLGEVLEALDYAHRLVHKETGAPLQLVHRDVSPQNIMIGFEGDVRLIDFGLAASTLKSEETAPNVVMGKVAYMSVEQLHGEPLDGSADHFAVGVIAYELLSGRRYYGERSAREIHAHAAAGSYRPERFDELPEPLRAILDRALAADPRERFASCGELREALEAYRFSIGARGDAPTLRALMQRISCVDACARQR
jgi:serine/threonine protein kinase